MQKDEVRKLLSIVVPVFNGEALLPECLRSIGAAVALLSQADRELIEVIVCDNHSSDATHEIASRFDPGCAYRIVQPPRHLSNRTENWNYGLRQASGEWLLMLHHDDMLGAASISEVLAFVGRKESSNAVAVTGRWQVATTTGALVQFGRGWRGDRWISGYAMRTHVLPYYCAIPVFSAFRRSAFEAVNGFEPTYELCQDWQFWIRLFEYGDCYAGCFDLGVWREHTLSIDYRRTLAKEHLRLIGEYGGLVPTVPRTVLARAIRMQTVRSRRLDEDQQLNDCLALLGATVQGDQHYLRIADQTWTRFLKADWRSKAVRRIHHQLAMLDAELHSSGRAFWTKEH